MAIEPLNNLPEHAIDHAALGIRKNARIPEVTVTPANPKAEDVWVVLSGQAEVNPGGFRILGLPMTYSPLGIVTYKEQYRTKESSTLTLYRDGNHYASGITYISGTGTAGVDNTAQTVKSITLPANTLQQLGDRLRIRTYWKGDNGSPVTGSVSVGPTGLEVLVSHTTDGGATTLQLNEVWLHYIDVTHANIIENEAGALGALSDINVAGFSWNTAQTIIFTQDQIANNHTILYALIVDIFPKGGV